MDNPNSCYCLMHQQNLKDYLELTITKKTLQNTISLDNSIFKEGYFD